MAGAIAASDLPPGTRLVAFMLSMHMNEAGGSCFPSQATLAEETGLSDRQVRRHLRVLEDGCWLSREHRPGPEGIRCFYTAEVPLEAHFRHLSSVDNYPDAV